MINKTNLTHASVRAKIYDAMRSAVSRPSIPRVYSRKGAAFISIMYLTGEAALRILGTFSGFLFLDADGRNITSTVLDVLRGS
jgi:hypothetical protein